MSAGVRPTTDRLRESLFNVLGSRVEGSRWLDAFAGSGAVGLEALSRGAAFVLFNEKERRAREGIRCNLERLADATGPVPQSSYQLGADDVFVLLRRLQAPSFDYVFLDPPYRFAHHRKLLERLLQSSLLRPETLVLLEVFKKSSLELIPAAFQIIRTLAAGDSCILFLKAGPNPSAGGSQENVGEAPSRSER